MFIEETRQINATPDQVWAVLADVERWPQWTTSMTTVTPLGDGPFGAGSKAKVKQPRLRATTMTVTSFEPGKAFTWETGAFGGKVIAIHEIAPDADGGTRIRLALQTKGGLTALMGPLFGKLSREYVNLEADGLKRQSEAAASRAA